MSKDGSSSDSSGWWSNFLTLGTLLLILGGCLTLLSWSEMNTGGFVGRGHAACWYSP